MPWLHSLFAQRAPSVASGVAAALQAHGQRRHPRARPGRRRRDGRHRLRLPVRHVRAQRRRALRLLRQRGVHEHRRAALGRDPAGRAHGDDRGGRPGPGNRVRARQGPAAHRDGARHPLRRHRDGRRTARPGGEGRSARCRCAARATCTCSSRARSAGDRLRPTPSSWPAWRSAAACSRCSRPSTATVTAASCRSAAQVPVEEYLRPQKRYAHLFGDRAAPRRHRRACRQIADRNIARYGLLAEEAVMMNKPFAITLDVGSSLANHTGTLAQRAPGLRRRAAAVQPRLPGRRTGPGLALRRRGRRLRDGLAAAGQRQPVPGDHGPGLLPPVRDGVQPRPARHRGRDQLGRTVPRRRGDPAGLAAAGDRPRRPAERVLVVGAGPAGLVGRLPPAPARPRGRDPRSGQPRPAA